LLRGPAYVTNQYNYVNTQDATTLWFHDHALGVVRENVYAGLAGFYFIRDNRDTGMPNNPITLPAGAQEAELMLADRQFDTNGSCCFPTPITAWVSTAARATRHPPVLDPGVLR